MYIDLSKIRSETAFWLLSDTHFGSNAFEEGLYRKHKKIARDADAFVFSLGDMMECVTRDSKVAELGGLFEQNLTIPEQRDMFVREMADFDVLTVIDGNHEERAWRLYGESPLEVATHFINHRQKKYKAEYLGIGGFVTVKLGDVEYVLHLHHGEGAATQYFDRLLRSRPGADVYAGGHNHALTLDPRSVLTPQGEKRVTWVRTGSYLNRPRYAAKKMYTHAEPDLGSYLMWLHPKKKKISFQLLEND